MKTFAARLTLMPVVVALSLGSVVARVADASPDDPNSITSLTPHEAAALAARFKGKDLPLNGLTELSPDVARTLCEVEIGMLQLDGVAEVSPDTALALAGGKSLGLSLGGLKTLSADVAATLAEFRGHVLWLGGLAELSAESARALAAFQGPVLMLTSLMAVDAEAAEALAEFKGTQIVPLLVVGIGRETPLTPGAARLLRASFAKSKADAVFLPNVTAIETPEAIEALEILVTLRPSLELPNLKTISARCLPILATRQDARLPPSDRLEILTDGVVGDDIVVP